MSKWKITVKQNKQKGQLDRVNNFLEGPQDLVGFEIITSITQDYLQDCQEGDAVPQGIQRS